MAQTGEGGLFFKRGRLELVSRLGECISRAEVDSGNERGAHMMDRGPEQTDSRWEDGV